jgi:hypothetical protein
MPARPSAGAELVEHEAKQRSRSVLGALAQFAEHLASPRFFSKVVTSLPATTVLRRLREVLR